MAHEDLRFGVFEIDLLRRRAVYADTPLHLTPKVFDLLCCLVQHRDRSVSKIELKEALWPGLRVEEANLTQTVFMLRKAFRDAGSDHDWIETVPGAGYRFAPPVTPTLAPAVQRQPRGQLARGVLGGLALVTMTTAAASLVRNADETAPQARPEGIARVASDPASEKARQAYLRGRSALETRTVLSLDQAARSFREAIANDPLYAEAHAGLARAYTLSGVFGGMSRRYAFPRAVAAAGEALRLNPDLADAHTTMAFSLQVGFKRWADAETRYRRALELDPNLAQAHHWYALLLDSLARPDEAIREIRTAASLAPLSLPITSDVGMILAHHGHFAEAIAQFERTIAMDPSYADAYQEMGWACAFAGRYAEAEAAFAKAEALSVPRPQVLAGLGYTFARSGRVRRARDALRAIESTTMADDGLKDSLQALVLLGLGEHDRALDLLVRAHPDGEPNLRVGRIYDPIRRDPRFQELLKRSGLYDADVGADTRSRQQASRRPD